MFTFVFIMGNSIFKNIIHLELKTESFLSKYLLNGAFWTGELFIISRSGLYDG